MREGRTLTRTMSIDSRQHEIVGVDLGEGVARGAAFFLIAVSTAWAGMLWLLGLPWTPNTVLVWIGPPSLLTWYGWSEGRVARRKKITEWVLAGRWIIHGHAPIVALGRHIPDRGECAGLKARVLYRLAGRAYPEHGKDLREGTTAGEELVLAPTVQLIGVEWMQQAMQTDSGEQ